MKIEVGDYIVGKEVFVVVAVNRWTANKSYDLFCLTRSSDTITYFEPALAKDVTYPSEPVIRSASHSYIRHLGKIVKKKDAKSLKILFG